jgi:hypothetical protein
MMDSWLESFAQAGFLRSSDTAHDLKTPLNVAVLNLELLRMRVRKLADGANDEKVLSYAQSIEVELRRMALIFDTFFILSTPPKNEGAPAAFDACAICGEAASAAGVVINALREQRVLAHESRIRQAFKMFFEGATRILLPEGRVAALEANGDFRLLMSGNAASDEFDIAKIFKFYYTDPQGNPDVSLAAARLIVETYGGELMASQERDKVTLRLSLPLGETE